MSTRQHVNTSACQHVFDHFEHVFDHFFALSLNRTLVFRKCMYKLLGHKLVKNSTLGLRK